MGTIEYGRWELAKCMSQARQVEPTGPDVPDRTVKRQVWPISDL